MKKNKSFDEIPLALEVMDLKEILSISLYMAYCLVHSGQIRCIRVGRKYLIPKDSLLGTSGRIENLRKQAQA